MRSRKPAEQLGFDWFVAQPEPPAAPLPPPEPPRAPAPRERVASGEAADHAPIRYTLRRAKRKTIGFVINDAGLTISAPRWVSLREIESAVAEKETWIRKKLDHWRDWRERRRLPELRFAEGGQLPYLGGTLVLRLAAVAEPRIVAVGTESHLQLALPPGASEPQVRDTLQAWLQGEARREFGARIAVLAVRAGVPLKSWALSSARAQWGSCTHDKRIRLNWRLIHFAPALIDYVIAHELAHLREMNHSPRFWAAVGEILPGFESARAELRGMDLGSLPL